MATQFLQDFGLAVRQLRESRGWSQEQLAEHAALNRSYIGDVERGQVSASLITVHKLADALRLRPTQLIAHCETIDQQRSASHARLMALAG